MLNCIIVDNGARMENEGAEGVARYDEGLR